MELKTKLVQLRKKNGLTQLDLAEKLNVSRQAISRWEAGIAIPSTENLKFLSELYEVSIDYLLNDGHEDSSQPGKVEQKERMRLSKRSIWIYVIITVCIVAVVLSLIYKTYSVAHCKMKLSIS